MCGKIEGRVCVWKMEGREVCVSVEGREVCVSGRERVCVCVEYGGETGVYGEDGGHGTCVDDEGSVGVWGKEDVRVVAGHNCGQIT